MNGDRQTRVPDNDYLKNFTYRFNEFKNFFGYKKKKKKKKGAYVHDTCVNIEKESNKRREGKENEAIFNEFVCVVYLIENIYIFDD